MAISATNAIAGCAAAAAVACAGVAATSTMTSGGATALSAPTAVQTLAYADAVRLAKQASFGPTPDLVNHMTQVGLQGWLDEQFAATGSTYADLESRVAPSSYCRSDPGDLSPSCGRDYLTAIPVAMRFYADALAQPDQLRQRVAWALSELMAVSDIKVSSTAGIAAFNQIFLDNAFGNYRDILRAVTLSSAMGDYLDLAGSTKAAPNENYAREMMQLFSTGVNQLNPDGTLKTDATGAPIPVYGAADVHDIARALTGWTYVKVTNAAGSNFIDYTQPLVGNKQYDTGAKSFLGSTVPAGAAQQASFDAVIGTVFNQPSTAPYVSRYLIQQLVVSNPSPAYVGRVSAVFADDGAGVRGDLKAVITAILTDPEARQAPDPNSGGKVKEPVLMATSLARAVGMTSDGYVFTGRDAGLGQKPFHAASVFSFYETNYPLPLGQPLLSPPSKLMTTATVIARQNLAYDWTIGADATRGEFAPQATIPGTAGTQIGWSTWSALGANVDGQLDLIDALMLDNGLTAAQRTAVRAAMTAVTDPDPTVQARKRAEVGLYVAASSPLFQTDR